MPSSEKSGGQIQHHSFGSAPRQGWHGQGNVLRFSASTIGARDLPLCSRSFRSGRLSSSPHETAILRPDFGAYRLGILYGA